MNAPDSYRHDETHCADKGDHLVVCASFRGKNTFGGLVRDTVVGKVDLDGNVLEIISQGPGFCFLSPIISSPCDVPVGRLDVRPARVARDHVGKPG